MASPIRVVAQLTYADAFREHLSEVVGFTVSLPWVRQHYFSDLAGQVWAIGAGAEKGLTLSVTDGVGNQVAGVRIDDTGTLTNQRTFALAFVNPDVGARPSRRSAEAALGSQGQCRRTIPAVSQAIVGANRMLMIGAASTLALARRPRARPRGRSSPRRSWRNYGLISSRPSPTS